MGIASRVKEAVKTKAKEGAQAPGKAIKRKAQEIKYEREVYQSAYKAGKEEAIKKRARSDAFRKHGPKKQGSSRSVSLQAVNRSMDTLILGPPALRQQLPKRKKRSGNVIPTTPWE